MLDAKLATVSQLAIAFYLMKVTELLFTPEIMMKTICRIIASLAKDSFSQSRTTSGNVSFAVFFSAKFLQLDNDASTGLGYLRR
jgi:hypothetical protein